LYSVYGKTSNEHLISGVTGQHAISLQKVNFPDTGMHGFFIYNSNLAES